MSKLQTAKPPDEPAGLGESAGKIPPLAVATASLFSSTATPPMPLSPDDLVAAGPWKTGAPAEEGTYLVQYETRGETGVSLFCYFEDHGWHMPTDSYVVLKYAPVHRPD